MAEQTRGGESVSPQIGNMGAVAFSDTENFSLPGIPFNIKNDGETAVTIEVNLWGMTPGEFVATRFETGWNPEIIREIKYTSQTLSLKWGY